MWRVNMRPEPKGGRGRSKTDDGGRSWVRVLKQIFGAPDYAAYLEHCRHAGHPPRLSEREYVTEFFERKGRTARCC
jgi:uncharacterized short protein YbdD (DUF466 family)